MPGTAAPVTYHHSQTKTSKSEKVTVYKLHSELMVHITTAPINNYSQFWLNRTIYSCPSSNVITTIILSGCLYGQTYGLSVRLYSYVCDD